MLRVSFIAFLSLFCSISFAKKYKVGNMSCDHFEERKQRASMEINSDDTNAKVDYNICLYLKGKSTGNQDEMNSALSTLHEFVEYTQNIPASFFLAYYYETGGNFEGANPDNLDEALWYNFHTLALIKNFSSFSNYPGITYYDWEEAYGMEEWSYFRIPSIYISMYVISTQGDFRQRLLDSPGYKGPDDLNTYPQYNYKKHGVGYLNGAIENAGICKNLIKKGHFSQDDFPYIKEVCKLFQKTAISLKEFDLERREILAQPNCQELSSITHNPNCPEIDEIHEEMGEIYEAMHEEIQDLRKIYLASSN